MGINIPPKLPEIVKLVPHQQQVASWDCGLACTSMVLTALGSRIYSPVELSNVIGVTSIWTIDVAYLLKRYGVEDFTYYTSYIGVNWDNIKSPFYNGDGTLQVDQPRIHSLFAAAKDAGVRVVQMILKLDDLRRFLRSERFVAIVLVDLNYIRCAVCAKRNRRGFALLDGWGRWIGWSNNNASSSSSTQPGAERNKNEARRSSEGSGNESGRRSDDGGWDIRRPPLSQPQSSCPGPSNTQRHPSRSNDKMRQKDPNQPTSPIPPPNPLYSSPVPIPALPTIAQVGPPGQRFRYRSLREMLFHMQPDPHNTSRSVPNSPIPSLVSHSNARRRRMSVEERLLERDDMAEIDEEETNGEGGYEGFSRPGYVSEIQPVGTGGEDEINPDHAKEVFERWYDFGTRVVDAVMLGPQMMVSGTVGMCARCGVGRDTESVSSSSRSSSGDDAEFSSLFCCRSMRRRRRKAKGLGVDMRASVVREDSGGENGWRWRWNSGNAYESVSARDEGRVVESGAEDSQVWSDPLESSSEAGGVSNVGEPTGRISFSSVTEMISTAAARIFDTGFASQLINTSASTRTLDDVSGGWVSGGWDAEAQAGTATTVSDEDESWSDAPAEPAQGRALWSALRWSITRLFESRPVANVRVQVEGSDMTEASGYHTPPLAEDLDLTVEAVAGWDAPVEPISYPVMPMLEPSTSSRRASWFAGSSAHSKETVVGWKGAGSVSRGGSPLRREERERSASGSGSVSSAEDGTEHKFHLQRAHVEPQQQQKQQGSSPSKRGIGNAGRGQGPGGMHRRHHTRPTSKGGDKDEEFVGHYVLLVGYDPEEDIFLYRDPGTTAELCAMSADEMERARCASGTDHDCIVIRVR